MSSSQKSSAPSVVPRPQLKNYVITDRLGSGTYATVYKAYRKVRCYAYLRHLYQEIGSDNRGLKRYYAHKKRVP